LQDIGKTLEPRAGFLLGEIVRYADAEFGHGELGARDWGWDGLKTVLRWLAEFLRIQLRVSSIQHLASGIQRLVQSSAPGSS
jgi:hypothetical protein